MSAAFARLPPAATNSRKLRFDGTQMIARHDAAARASGARIVFSCGFDSIPFDLGVLYLQSEAQCRFGAPLKQVRGRVRVMKGGFSGGTI